MLKSLARKTVRKLRNRLRPAPAKAAAGGLRLSLVVPTWNAGRWLDRLLHSIFTQTSHLRSFEVIIVDDGSTDDSARIAKEWQRRYPDHICYVHQENAGLSSARNAGMALARGTWISFPDPDDFLDKDYFRKMLKETEVRHERPLLAVSANIIPYHEATDKFVDNHPLRYRFAKGVVRRSTSDLKDHVQLNVASCWLRRDAIVRHGLEFDPRVVPGSEDTHFINRLFVCMPHGTISFLPAARYYYRKRITKDSLINTGHSRPEWYLDQIRYGILDLLNEAHRCLGHVPRYLQRTCLYVLFWRIRHVVDHQERMDLLMPAEKVEFENLLRQAMEFIEPPVIAGFGLAGCTEEHRVALLWHYKKMRRNTTAVYLKDMDVEAGIAQFSYFTGGGDDYSVRPVVNGSVVEKHLPSRRHTEFMGQTWFEEHFFWVRIEDGDEISFEGDEAPCRIRYRSNALGDCVGWLNLRRALAPEPPTKVDADTRRLRAYVQEARNIYRGCQVLMDKEDRADDNAEHLYRHMMRTGRADNAWFVLRRDSSDWNRLESEGFRLLEHGSDDHVAAQMNAAYFISSHGDESVLWPVSKKYFSDIAHYQFVYLRHGVITTDRSRWMNGKDIRLVIASMEKEVDDLTRPNGNHKVTTREVLHSGLPRHDALLNAVQTFDQNSLLIMPTWRKYLTGEFDAETGHWSKIDGFANSAYWRNWSELLWSERLRELAQKHDLVPTFVPHPNVTIYLEDMDTPEWLHVVDVNAGQSYQRLLAAARVGITDFSSTASEVAFLQRQVIYFQFDAEEMLGGGHVCKQGYFSYENDGFGPVETTADGVLDRLEQALSGREDPVYAARRDAAFPFRDGNCCERVCRAIEQLGERRPVLSPLRATQVSVESLPAGSAADRAADRAQDYAGNAVVTRHGNVRSLAGR